MANAADGSTMPSVYPGIGPGLMTWNPWLPAPEPSAFSSRDSGGAHHQVAYPRIMRQSLEAAYGLAIEARVENALAADAERLEATPVHPDVDLFVS